MPTEKKTLADIRDGDYVAFYSGTFSFPVKYKATLTDGGITPVNDSRWQPEFDTKTGRRRPAIPGDTSYITVITPDIQAFWKHQENLTALRERVSQASPDRVEAMLRDYPAQREHIVQLNNADRMQLLEWLERPNGSCRLRRACFEAAENGGILVRTEPYG